MAKTWIKMYTEILSDPKMGRMSDKLFRRTVELFLIAGTIDNNGEVPSVDDIAWMLHTTPKEIQTVINDLLNLKIIGTKSEKYFILHYAERQNSDLTRSEINKRYYEKTKQAKSENKTEIQTEVRPDSDVAMSEIQTLEEEVEVEEDINTLTNVSVYAPDKKSASAPKSEKHKYGSAKNVLLTDEQYQKLRERFIDADDRIENLSLGIASKGYKYKDHYATILNWARMDAEKAKAQPKPQGVNEYPDIYTMIQAEASR